MSPAIYIFSICVLFGTPLAIFAIRYYASVQQAKLRHANGDAWREVAEKAAAAQVDTASALSAVQTSLSELNQRLVSVEKILRDVG